MHAFGRRPAAEAVKRLASARIAAGAPTSRQAPRQAPEQAEARVGVLSAPEHEARDTAGDRDEVSQHEAGYHEIASTQVLSIDHPLADAVGDVEPLELVARPPVVMPDDEVRFVQDPSSCTEPAVREVVVLGGRADTSVEAAEVENRRATKRHALCVENEVRP